MPRFSGVGGLASALRLLSPSEQPRRSPRRAGSQVLSESMRSLSDHRVLHGSLRLPSDAAYGVSDAIRNVGEFRLLGDSLCHTDSF